MAKDITVQFEDGSAHIYRNVPSSISIDDVNERAAKEFGKAVVSDPSLLHTGKVGLNAIYKGIGSGVDALLNTPTNIANLGIAAYGTAKGALGGTDLPEPMQTPDYARRGLESVGLIRQDVAPQSTSERIVDVGGQGIGGAFLGPAGSRAALARNLAMGGISGLASQGTKEATGSDVAATLASFVAPMAVSGLASAGRNQISRLGEEQAANAARDKITTAGQEKGYVLPASEVNSSAFNKTIESIGGKAATRQEAEIRNQPVTNALVREQIGLNKNQPITEESLNALRNEYAAPYREIAAIPPITSRQQVPAGIDPVTNQPITKFVSKVFDPAKILEELKTARADANAWWKAYSRDAHPETKAKAEQFKQKAEQLESELEQVAINSNKPELVAELRDARSKIAQTYTVEQALNIGTTNVDARAIGRMLDRGAPLTGNLKLIGEFAQQNPLYTRETSGVSTPGVSALDAMAAGMAVAGGKPLSGGVVLARGPARAAALSKWYQKLNARPDYSPSMMAKLLRGFTPEEARLAMAKIALQKSQAAQQEQE